MSDCVFCEIVAGRAPSRRVLADEHTLAFLNIRPAAPGHTLVVPRRHVRDMWDISEVEHGHVASMVRRAALLLRQAFEPDGVNVRVNSGAAAGQDVFHFHTHLIPRRHGDGLQLTWASPRADPAELERAMLRIAEVRV
ncbi:HIT family protein [Catenulispora pinisilvae]|uniref:HIT family protein n=1 Tax=Catenulispora pinisilvae TaxID=2705253 RepID=UPI001892153E|nr:HIT family protein [Catenulispora pinisilvae]